MLSQQRREHTSGSSARARYTFRGMGRLAALVCALTAIAGCASRQEEIRVASDVAGPSAAEIDEDPWRLLPTGAVAYFRADSAIWKAQFGPALADVMLQYLPFAEGAGVDPQSEIDLLVGAAYATVATDVVLIGQGRFDADKTDAAVTQKAVSVSGKPIVRTRFAGATMYVADGAAMAILSSKTMVFGTQLGVRRVLETVEEGRMKRTLPTWFESLLDQESAAFQLGIDLDSQPVPAVLRTRLNFLNHLRAGRLLGNYQEPGLNLVGSLTFDTPQAASDAEAEMKNAVRTLERYDFLLAALEIPPPLRKLTAEATGKDTQVAIEIHGNAVQAVLQRLPLVLAQALEQEETN